MTVSLSGTVIDIALDEDRHVFRDRDVIGVRHVDQEVLDLRGDPEGQHGRFGFFCALRGSAGAARGDEFHACDSSELTCNQGEGSLLDMMTYWEVWNWYQSQLEENGRSLTREQALAFFEESGGVIVHPREVLPPEVVHDR